MVEEGEGEEEYVGPEVEHLREVEGGDMVGFVAWMGGQLWCGLWGWELLPRTTPLFQRMKALNAARKVRCGMRDCTTVRRLMRVHKVMELALFR